MMNLLPLAVRRLLNGGITAQTPDSTTTGGPLPRPVYWGLQRARMSVADEGGSRTVFTFERKGPFEWKLVHVGLPDGVAPVAAPEAGPVARQGG